MSEDREIDGLLVVRWISEDVTARAANLVGLEYADDDYVWRIDSASGPLLTLSCDDPVIRKTVNYQLLGAGAVYVRSDNPIVADLDSAKTLFDKLVEEARGLLRVRRLCGGARLSDTEAVSLLRIVKPWLDAGRLPSREQLDQATEYFERSVPPAGQAYAMLGDWLKAAVADPARTRDEPSFRIHYASLLRAASRPRDALAATDVLIDARAWKLDEQQRAILLTIRAAALMDVFELDRDQRRLDEADRRLRNAYAIQGPNEHLNMTFARLKRLRAER